MQLLAATGEMEQLELSLYADVHFTNQSALLVRIYHDHALGRAERFAAVSRPALAGLNLAQSSTWHAGGVS